MKIRPYIEEGEQMIPVYRLYQKMTFQCQVENSWKTFNAFIM